MKLTQKARECTILKKEPVVESGACGQKKFGNNELRRSSGAGEEVSVVRNKEVGDRFFCP